MAASTSIKIKSFLLSRRIHFLIPDTLRREPPVSVVSAAAAGVGGESGAGQATDNATAAAASVGGESGATDSKSDGRFSPWMMDPTTGFWMPENHINSEQVDPVVVREMHLAKKK